MDGDRTPQRKGTRRSTDDCIHVGQALGCEADVEGMTSIQQQLQSLYNAEFSESTADLRECLSVEDRCAKAMMDDSIKLVEGHYEIGLPWKYDEPSIPNNRSMERNALST